MAGKAKKKLQRVTDTERELRLRVDEAKTAFIAAKKEGKRRSEKKTKEIADRMLHVLGSSAKLVEKSAANVHRVIAEMDGRLAFGRTVFEAATENDVRGMMATCRAISGIRPALQAMSRDASSTSEAIRMLSASYSHLRQIGALSDKVQAIAKETAAPRQLPLFGAPAAAEISMDVQIACPRCGRACWQKEITTVMSGDGNSRRCPGCVDEVDADALAVLGRHRELAERHQKLNPGTEAK